MTETEWRACLNPRLMLFALRGKAYSRKLQLFSCACCRLVWHLLPGFCHSLVIAVENYADKEIETSELHDLLNDYHKCTWPPSIAPGGAQAAAATSVLGQHLGSQHLYTSSAVARSAAESLAKSMPWREARQLEAEFLHDVFGCLPFRRVVLDTSWVTWNNGTILMLAKTIYEDRNFDHLPVLADALEEAGCRDEEILGHCRGPGPHVRGCWIVDLLLGKR